MDFLNTDKFKDTAFFKLLVVLSMSLASCKSGEGIGLGTGGDQLGANSTDTLTVAASSFLLDPLPTAATGTMLAGQVVDEDLGKITVSSYFRISNSELNLADLPTDASYDSLTLRLFYSNYHYGDTTAQLTLTLHRLSEQIELTELPVALEDDEYPVFVSGETLWSDRRFAYDTRPLGQTVFTPRPTSTTDTVRIRLDDGLGTELFDMVVNEDSRLFNTDDFNEYLKGFVLVPGEAGKCVIGLQDSLALNLHYSYERQSDGMRVSDTLVFSIGATSYQYHHVDADRGGTMVANLSYDNPEVTSSATGHRTFIQGTSGIVTRLRFPSARQFLNSGNIALSKAQLIIETDQSADGPFAPPPSLVLMIANAYGTPTSFLNASYGDASQIANYQSPGQAGGAGNGSYVFDLTEYLSEMQHRPDSESESLLLTLPIADLMGTVNRLAIASHANKPAIKLHLLYVKF